MTYITIEQCRDRDCRECENFLIETPMVCCRALYTYPERNDGKSYATKRCTHYRNEKRNIYKKSPIIDKRKNYHNYKARARDRDIPSTNIIDHAMRRVARSDFASFEAFMRGCEKEFPTKPKQENDKICRFCKKKLNGNHKTIKVYKKPNDKIYTCNNCSEFEANNKQTIKNILWYLG